MLKSATYGAFRKFCRRTCHFYQLTGNLRQPCRLFSCTDGNQQEMKAWLLRDYESYTSLEFDSIDIPRIGPDEVLVKVSAASVNPLDVEMAKGYGRRVLNSLRDFQGIKEFPLILGRDCSGTIIRRGRKVRRFSVGEEVWCSRWVTGQGTHASYVPVKINEVSRKPSNLSHVNAACLPFVACTVWPSLVSRGGLTMKSPGKRVLILGGSGGIGSFAVQLARIMKAIVTATARTNYATVLKTFGAETVLDYQDPSHLEELNESERFDIVMDCRGGIHDDVYRSFLADDPLATYISLMPPVLPSTDANGLAYGMVDSALQFFGSNKNHFMYGQGVYSWGFYFPSSGILESVKHLVEKGHISPLLDSIYDFSNANLAYQRLAEGGVKGKVVISMDNL